MRGAVDSYPKVWTTARSRHIPTWDESLLPRSVPRAITLKSYRRWPLTRAVTRTPGTMNSSWGEGPAGSPVYNLARAFSYRWLRSPYICPILRVLRPQRERMQRLGWHAERRCQQVCGRRLTTQAVADGLASNTVASILESRDGALWFAAPVKLSRVAHGKWNTWWAMPSVIAVRMLAMSRTSSRCPRNAGRLHSQCWKRTQRREWFGS